MPAETPDLDVLAFFLARMPFIALPGPPRFLALAGPKRASSSAPAPAPITARAPTPAPAPVRAPAPAPARAPVIDDDLPTPPPPPKPKPAPKPQVELSPSPFDPGFNPPTTGLRERPETNPGPDPRTLSLNRAKRPSTVAMRAPTPLPTTNPRAPQPSAAFDLLILPQMPTFKTSEHGLHALIGYLRTAQMLSPRVVHTSDEGIVYDFVPDVFQHQMFVEGQAPGGEPCLLEATLRSMKTPMPVRYGPPARTSCISLELVGCRYGFVLEQFKQRLHQILYLRPEVHVVAHDPRHLRSADVEHTASIPAFDMQEVDRG